MTPHRRPRYRPLVAVAGLLLAAGLTIGPAAAGGLGIGSAPGLSLAWLDCRDPVGAGAANFAPGCGSDIQEWPLFPSFSLAAQADSVFSMELVIDVIVANDSLPPWWLMAPGCRANAWAADGTPSTSCLDAWNGLGTGSFQGWLPGTPGGARNHARLLVAAGTLPDDAVTLLANTAYTACRVLLRTVNSSTCGEGCETPACLVFNSLLIRRHHTPADEEFVVTGGENGGSDRVTWKGGLGADCQAVPVRRTTWGAVKALYR